VKGILRVSLALLVSALLVMVTTVSKSKHRLRPVYAQSGCNIATLSDKYAFSDSGFEKTGFHRKCLRLQLPLWEFLASMEGVMRH
jgi:hypothetical protein